MAVEQDDEHLVEHLLNEMLTRDELVHICEIAAQFLGMDAVIELLERHAFGGTVH